VAYRIILFGRRLVGVSQVLKAGDLDESQVKFMDCVYIRLYKEGAGYKNDIISVTMAPPSAINFW
jgi:hypothetical protein